MSGPWTGRRIHFVGIGGAGMSGWARVAIQLGAQVSGSDREDSPALAKLRALGAEVHVGHDAGNVRRGAEVFYSSAVPESNPERGRDAKPRAALLAELTSLKRVIAVAGAHGKTTTTSMIAHALLVCGMEPGYLIGGALRTTGENSDWGAGEWLVVEADESDRSMLALDVDVAVVLNVELDHHATFSSLAELQADFDTFVAGAGQVVQAAEAEGLELVPGGSRFLWRGHAVELIVPGEHNAANAAAALEACRLAGADEVRAAASLADFQGAGRRFERLGETPAGALVVDDYAHHPTEVAATIAAGRTLGRDRVVAVFQPHLYSRTKELHARFAEALRGADAAVVLEVYPARERAADFPGVSGRLIADAAGAAFASTFDEAYDLLAGLLLPGDLVLVMGAGDVDTLAHRLATEASDP